MGLTYTLNKWTECVWTR